MDTLNRLFDDFWAVRNRIVHGAQIDLSRNTELSLLDLGVELLRLIQISPRGN